MSYAQAMRHRPHRLHMGHTFNPSGIQWSPPKERPSRVRCPGCARKFSRTTVSWHVDGVAGPAMCKRCNDKRFDEFMATQPSAVPLSVEEHLK